MELPGGKSGHRQFRHQQSGAKVTLPGHGPKDLTKKHVGMIRRTVEALGLAWDPPG